MRWGGRKRERQAFGIWLVWVRQGSFYCCFTVTFKGVLRLGVRHQDGRSQRANWRRTCRRVFTKFCISVQHLKLRESHVKIRRKSTHPGPRGFSVVGQGVPRGRSPQTRAWRHLGWKESFSPTRPPCSADEETESQTDQDATCWGEKAKLGPILPSLGRVPLLRPGLAPASRWQYGAAGPHILSPP